jgi:hypothetical protein
MVLLTTSFPHLAIRTWRGCSTMQPGRVSIRSSPYRHAGFSFPKRGADGLVFYYFHHTLFI